MEEEILLSDLLELIKEKWKFLVFFTIIGALLAANVTLMLIKPKYQVSTTVIVGNSRATEQEFNATMQYNEVITNQKLVSTYVEIMKSRTVAEKVKHKLDLPLSTGEISKKISAQAVKDTEVIKLSVKDTNPERAMQIANETLNFFKEEIIAIKNIDNVQILDRAVMPESPSSPNLKVNILVGAFIGFMLSGAFVLLKNILDNTVSNAENIEKELGLAVLGEIPYVRQNNKDKGDE